MNIDQALFLLAQTFQTAGKVAGPILIVSLLVGLAISIFQVVTQIQEMSLTFVPKIVASIATMGIIGYWMLSVLVGFMQQMLSGQMA